MIPQTRQKVIRIKSVYIYMNEYIHTYSTRHSLVKVFCRTGSGRKEEDGRESRDDEDEGGKRKKTSDSFLLHV